jgi:hypothetical protein
MSAIEAALRRADALLSRPDPRPPVTPARWYAIGDPQASARQFFSVLDRHSLLDPDGSLAPDVGLVSMGDHFDYPSDDVDASRVEGRRILAWLASHSQEQVSILLGNHDAVRVQELIGLDVEGFDAAHQLALRVDDPEAPEQEEDFLAVYPELPPSEQVRRDFKSYAPEQRDLVVELLLAGRFRLALCGRLADGREALFTHATVSSRECEQLGSRDARGIADALQDFLEERVGWIRADWEAGRRTMLDLAPLHLPGGIGREGGGLLYHRPTAEADDGSAAARRKFSPDELPSGLVQVCGHTGHRKFLERSGDWATPSAEALPLGRLRTLIVEGEDVRYFGNVLPAPAASAVVYMIDGTLSQASVADYQLLEIDGP